MQTATRTAPQAASVSRTALWIGSMFSGFVILFLLFDVAIRLMVR